jgi:ubiquitin-activating enzyme E1
MSIQIDESLYSRQLYAIGKDTMQSVISSKVLIINLDPLAIEICKNIILMGVGTVTLADENKVISEKDLGNYYINENDIGKKRSDIIGKRISELNTNCVVNKYSGKINENIVSKYNLIVFIDCNFNEQYLKLNEYCRSKNIKTIFTSSHGFYGYIFCDFGTYITYDIDGEKIKSGIILSCVDKICMTDKNHDFSVGDKFKMNNLDNEYEIIKIINSREFSIDKNIDNLGEYTEIKKKVELNFKSLRESILDPEFIITDFSDFDMPAKLHDINVKMLTEQKDTLNLEDKFVKKIIDAYDGFLTPLNSIIGGLCSHNIISGLSNKYTPIKQWLYYECHKICEPEKVNYNYSAIYSNQVKVIGTKLQEKLSNTNLFIVGSGAIGCEHLKNFSMMGIGHQTITDMDIIEKSNLSRQFLFRNTDIGKYKAEIATKKAKIMNKYVNIDYKLNRVGIETEHIFNNNFYSKIDIIVNALDNINARLYMDNQAIIYQKPLLESGTLGLKGNVQVIIPHITESYGSTQDKAEEQIPVCTLKNFPYEISHCIQWAREQFESIFVLPFQTYNKLKKYYQEDKLKEKLDKMLLNELYDIKQHLEIIKSGCENSFSNFFNDNYRQKIYDLINQYPEDYIANGEKFWSGVKKFPRVIDFTDDTICVDLLTSYEQIMNSVGFKFNRDKLNMDYILKKTDKKFAVNSDEDKKIQEEDLNLLNVDDIKTEIIALMTNTTYKFNEIEFEKDDDTMGHIKFMTACSNLRAKNYSINIASEFETKGIAGKIIPALATTTSVVSGLVAIELYKLINFNETNYKIEDYKNTFMGLGVSFIGSSEPVACKSVHVGKLDISLWTKLKYDNMTIIELINKFKNEFNVEIDQIIFNNTSIYTSYMNETKRKEILNKNIKSLVNKTDNIILQVSITDDNDISEIINLEII